jgi:excisionase family DNA binding protein
MEKLLSRKEVAERLSVSVDTIKRWERAGKIACIKLPGAVRFRAEWLENWLNKRTIKAKS